MSDHREDELQYIQGKHGLTVLKGGLYLCEIRNNGKFKEILAGNFNLTVGLTGDTLIAIGEFVKKLEEQHREHK